MIKLKLAKELLLKIMRKYPKLGRVYPVEGGIHYGKGGYIPDRDVQRIVHELSEE